MASLFIRMSHTKLRRLLLLIGVLCVCMVYYIAYIYDKQKWSSKSVEHVASQTLPCYLGRQQDSGIPRNVHPQSNKVLVFVESDYSQSGQEIITVLESHRISYRTIVRTAKDLPVLTTKSQGVYILLVFEDVFLYASLDQWRKDTLMKYCKDFGVGMIFFSNPQGDLGGREQLQLFEHSLYISMAHESVEFTINPECTNLGVTKSGQVLHLPDHKYIYFISNHSSFYPLSFIKPIDYNGTRRMSTIIDRGLLDGIGKAFIGGDLSFWVNKLLFLDVMSHLTGDIISTPNFRYIIVDIDDIFVGAVGIRMRSDDVAHLIDTQTRIREFIPGFTFNLGFSGKYFLKGTPEEDEGDMALIQSADRFVWFCHMWGHEQPHLINSSAQLATIMRKNKDFAFSKGIPVSPDYSVAPHHSGVYPVHQPLYAAWRSVWGVRVTSTEEYPHLRPEHRRSGFIHDGIKVLPRQTCGLFTKTNHYDSFPGGWGLMETSIRGGRLFQTVVDNPVNIFMTHFTNYGNDRLAPYTFTQLVEVLSNWTNLQLRWTHPASVADIFFKLFPSQRDPLWTNPCDDHRHLEIWNPEKSCRHLPQLLILGPQKTGTTALYNFLKSHKSTRVNVILESTFEEPQFFSNNEIYRRGIDWYGSLFPKKGNVSLVFEKSATYFDSSAAPERVKALLPKAKLVVMLIDPGNRAYSWYQHQRAHNDPTALAFTFEEVVRSNSTYRKLRQLRNRCLDSGYYADHLRSWLKFFPPSQLFVIDGEYFRNNPVPVMNKLEKFSRLKPHIDYNDKLIYSPNKGFYCIRGSSAQPVCLGSGKGRQYQPMSESLREYFKKLYYQSNSELYSLLVKFNIKPMSWLQSSLSLRSP